MSIDDDETPGEGEAEIRALVAAAEEIADPLEGLVELSKTDAGAPFRPEALAALRDLRNGDQPAFERLRAELKHAGVRVSELDLAIARSHALVSDPDAMAAFTEGADLVAMMAEFEFFCSPHGNAYADVHHNGHRETFDVESMTFADLLTRRYYEAYRAPPPNDELRGAISMARARAKFDGHQREVHVRVAGVDGKIYIDLGDAGGRAVEIDEAGWRVIADPPIRFIRPPGCLPLPEPQRGGSLDLLRSLLNVRDDSAFVLVIAFLLAALKPTGPYPLLVLMGEQGTAKTTATRLLKSLVDPTSAAVRLAPGSAYDLYIAASNGWMLAYDNLGKVSGDISNAFCTLSTGGGFSVRKHYTNNQEVLFNASRPVILNGIDGVVTRPDLADRSLFVELERIPASDRLPESLLLPRFKRDHPLIIGVLFDGLAHGLREVGNVKLERAPRLADFATFGVAIEGAFWSPGTFLKAYETNRRIGTERSIERDVVASAVARLMARHAAYRGTATQLLKALSMGEDDRMRRSRDWPPNHSQLSRRLRPLVAPLREIGIEVEWTREGHGNERTITLRRVTEGSSSTTPPDPTTDKEPNQSNSDGS